MALRDKLAPETLEAHRSRIEARPDFELTGNTAGQQIQTTTEESEPRVKTPHRGKANWGRNLTHQIR